TEVPAGAAQHHGSHVAASSDRVEHGLELGDHLQAHGVAYLGAVEHEDEHTVVAELRPHVRARRKAVRLGHRRHPCPGFGRRGSVPSSLQMIPSMISSAPPPIEASRPSRKNRETFDSHMYPIPPQNWMQVSAT